jgi:NAD(P)-dependent dehydrogenase (short-subunit alcohol dehydrogenase family)/acyl carrier protein
MSRAAHIGKIVVTQRPAWSKSTQGTPVLHGDCSYLITGGLGGLGLLFAEWMAAHGARHLILLGRQAPSPSASATLSQLAASGVAIRVERGDVSVEADVSGMLARAAREMPPLRGIIHAAGTLDDGALHRQDWSRFQRVMAAKVYGSLHLHRLTSHLPIDFFVLFSSAASMLGTPGQSNHAAANAFMDSLAHLRRSCGLPALAINWGVWARIGAAAERNVADRIPIPGMESISPQQGLALFETLLDHGSCQAGAFAMDWRAYASAEPARAAEVELLTKFASANRPRAIQPEGRDRSEKVALPQSAPLSHLDLILHSPPGQRHAMLARFVEEHVLRALGIDPSRPPDRRRPLQELGLDSLLAVELRNQLTNGLGLSRRLPATLLFDYPSIAAIADYLAAELLPHEPDPLLPESRDDQADLAQIATLSDEEAEALLLEELNEN